MDIYSPPGTKVIFLCYGGWDYEKQAALKELELYRIYTVYKIEDLLRVWLTQ